MAAVRSAREIALMRRLDRDGHIAFVDVTSATCPLDRQAMLARLHAREGEGPMLSGAAAFAAMWRAIPMLRPLGLLGPASAPRRSGKQTSS